MAKKAYRVRNWSQYNEALVNRGSITFWFSEEIIKDWHTNDSQKTRGRPRKYSDIAIQCGLTLKAVFKLSFRAIEGFLRSLISLLKLKAQAPDYSLLCKRQKNLKVNFSKKNLKSNESIHILVDSTGLKIFGEGEWKVRQHGYMKRRVWRKLHLAVNADTQEIEAFELTELNFQDGDGLQQLINKIDKKIDRVTGDGAFDQYKSYKLAEEKKFKLITPPKRDAKQTKECTGYSTRQKHTPEMLEALKNRDEFIERIREVGRDEWKKEIGYHQRSLVETAMFRIKTLLGNKLSTRNFEYQQVEVAIWCNIINQMTKLGMPV
jgi:Transposase DDE domain